MMVNLRTNSDEVSLSFLSGGTCVFQVFEISINYARPKGCSRLKTYLDLSPIVEEGRYQITFWLKLEERRGGTYSRRFISGNMVSYRCLTAACPLQKGLICRFVNIHVRYARKSVRTLP